MVFKNDEFLGDFNDLNEFIWKKWKYVFNQDWYKLASDHLIEYLESKTEQCVSKIRFLHRKSSILSNISSNLTMVVFNNSFSNRRNFTKIVY